MLSLGDRLKSLRQKAGFSSGRRFAKEYGFHPGRYSSWEGNRATPNQHQLQRLSAIFGIDLGIHVDARSISHAMEDLIGLSCGCEKPDFSVLESRPANKSGVIRRRRLCRNCKERITTYELRADTVYQLLTEEKTHSRKVSLELLKALANCLLDPDDSAIVNTTLRSLGD